MELLIILISLMKRIIDIKTIQFVDPQPSFDSPSPTRYTIASDLLTSHNTPIESLRGSKMSKKYSQNSKINILKVPTPPERNSLGGKQRLSKSQNGKRSMGKDKKRYNETLEEDIPKSHSITRYDPRKDSQQSQPDDPVKASFHITSQTRKRLVGAVQIPEERLKTEPSNCVNIKSQLMRRICKKINFMKRMTSQGEPTAPSSILDAASSSPSKSLFRFDKFYDHCVKNINRCINIYEKDVNKEKDKKYFELKTEGGILTKELMEIRNELAQKEQVKEDHHLGVVGSGIEVKSFEKAHSHRVTGSHHKKKVKKINRNIEKDIKNPFRMDDMHGWEFRIDRNEDFYI